MNILWLHFLTFLQFTAAEMHFIAIYRDVYLLIWCVTSTVIVWTNQMKQTVAVYRYSSLAIRLGKQAIPRADIII